MNRVQFLEDEMSKPVSRRDFLKISVLSSAGVLLASCAPAATTAPVAPTKAADTPAAQPASKDKSVLRVVSGQDITEITIRTQVAKMYEVYNPKVSVQMDIVSGDRAQSQLTMIAGGNPPDILYLNDFFQYAFASKGLLTDLNPYIAKDKFDFTPYLKEAVEANVYKQQMTAMPFEVADMGLVYNKKLFDEAKVPYPTADLKDPNWNWESMIETAKKLTDESKNQFGIAIDSWMIPNWLLCYDQRYLSNNKEITADTKSVMNTENTVKVNQMWLDLMNVHKVSPSAAMSQEIGGFDRFMSGKVAMYSYGRWLNTFRQIRDFEWDVAPLPAFKGTHPGAVMYILNYGIYSKSNNKDVGWDFLKFINTEQPQVVNVMSGMAVAALNQVNSMPEFLNNAPPANNVVYADTMPYAKLWDSNEIDYMKYANQTLGQLYGGQRSDTAAVIKEASDGIDKALNEYRAQNK
jgi:multiple sugar transport system substrate-binding protein